jgi:hypothetical protein
VNDDIFHTVPQTATLTTNRTARTPRGSLETRLATTARWFVIAAASMLLAACFGTASVMKEDAAALSAATEATVVQSREFYARLGNARQNYFLVSVANDANCRLEDPIYLMPDSSRPGGFRCLTKDEADRRKACATTPPGNACPGGDAQAILPGLQSFTLGDIEKSSALELVAVVSEYQALLAQIVADDAFDATAKLTALQGRINKVGAALDMLGGAFEKLAFEEQIGAVGKLANLVRQAIVDHRDLEKLRTLMSSDDAVKFEEALGRLAIRYKSMDKKLLDALDHYSVELARKQYNEKVADLTPEERLARLSAWSDKRAAVTAARAAPDVLGQAFDQLLKSYGELRGAIVEGKYTEKQRRAIAQKNLAQLKSWFQALRGFIGIF